MLQKSVNLFHVPIEELFQQVRRDFPSYEYDHKKHVIIINDDSNELIGSIRLPLHLAIDEQLTIIDEAALVMYLSIESGNAAICMMQGKENIYHTTFGAYMTRKKQGVSQIKYLNKKGKSRAGSRVRLAATIEFFEKINATLGELMGKYDIERIALNCNTTLIPYLHQSKVACPFGKQDSLLYKIPLHIPQSNYTNLDKTIKKLMAPMLFYDEKHEDLINVFVGN